MIHAGVEPARRIAAATRIHAKRVPPQAMSNRCAVMVRHVPDTRGLQTVTVCASRPSMMG